MKVTEQIAKKNSELFDQYLVNFQKDIRRICGKFKKSFHVLTEEEIYSECNLWLLKAKDKILDSCNGELLVESEFKKIAYHYVKNETTWSHYRVMGKSYNKRRSDGVMKTDDGEFVSVFEMLVSQQGEENKDIDNDELFISQNCKHFFNILRNYYHLLTNVELRVLSYLEKGYQQEYIAQQLGVTHQAISSLFVSIQEKLQNHFDINEILNGGSNKKITKGRDCIDDLFNEPSDNPKVSDIDRDRLDDFVKKFPYTYNIKKINETLFNNKYSNQKVAGAIKSLKLTPFIVSSSRPIAVPIRNKMLKYFNQGKTIKKVSELLHMPVNTIRRMRSQFVIDGKLKNLKEQ